MKLNTYNLSKAKGKKERSLSLSLSVCPSFCHSAGYQLSPQLPFYRFLRLTLWDKMFYLSEIEHTLRLPPHLLNLPLHDAIKGELEGLFLDKVIVKLGLCVSVYDIKSIDGGFIFPGDGASTYTVQFRLIMFRPFIGEVITAKLKGFDINGLHLSLGFFDDIYVPVHLMPFPSKYEKDPNNLKHFRWVWEFEGQQYLVDGVDEIRFRVDSINYPPLPVVQELDSQPVEQPKQKKPFAPMVITGALDADGGLGHISWWI